MATTKGKTAPLKVIPLGGLDGIGKNMTVIECGPDMMLVDAGLMFPDDSQHVRARERGQASRHYYHAWS